jgi:hypothetical protein
LRPLHIFPSSLSRYLPAAASRLLAAPRAAALHGHLLLVRARVPLQAPARAWACL